MRLPLIVLLLTSSPVFANDHLSWQHLEVALVGADLDLPARGSGDGIALSGSYALADQWYARGELYDASVDIGPPVGDRDYTLLRLGVGFHTELAEGITGFGEGGLDRISGGGSDTGLGLRFGMRGSATDGLEFTGHVRFTTMDVLRSSDVLIGVGAAWRFAEAMAVTFGYESGDLSHLALGLRIEI